MTTPADPTKSRSSVTIWKTYLPKLYAGQRPPDFGEYRDRVVAPLRRPDFADPRAEAGWIARGLRAQIVMVPGAGHYPQSQQPDITAGAILRFLAALHTHPGRPGQHGGTR
ncbi:MAG: alpha/beta fold hydrolase [Streptosporangiaceae bacterium]